MKSRFLRLSLVFTALSILPAHADTSIVAHADSWHYRKGTNAPQSNWKTVDDTGLDATWLAGNGGIGYADNTPETANCQTLLTDMINHYSTLYMRRSFTIASPVDTSQHLQLRMDFDDGFIVWLDGVYLTNRFITGAPLEPAYNALANASHESSLGNSTFQPAEYYDFGLVGSRLAVGTHTLAIIGVNNTLASSDLIQVPDLSLVPPPVPLTNTWYSSNSPIVLTTNVNIQNLATLIIEAGTTVQLGSGINIIVANGGKLLAEGTSNAPIRFTRSGASGNWGNITITGANGSPESRITYARFEFNVSDAGTPAIAVEAGAAFLDHLDFATPGSPYIHVDGASFIISHCYFPKPTAGFEPCHGMHGVRTDGHGIFRRNFFGHPTNYNDVVDFTGSQRGNPIVHFINNVVTGGDDDGWDLDGTDAWVEGNIFCHMHRNGVYPGPGTPDSSSAISGGNFTFSAGENGGVGTETSQVTIIGNIIYDCDEASDSKEGNFFTYFNNTIVHETHVGGTDPVGGVILTYDTNTVDLTRTAEGAGVYLEGNIIYDIEALTRQVETAIVTFTNNLLPVPWTGLGGSNVVANPMFNHVPLVSETFFTNWDQAQIMWEWLGLQSNSPAIGAGPNGRNLGAVVPIGASISGEPVGTVTNTSATLHVGINRKGSGIPATGWPNGAGYVAYKWRLDGGAWSAEIPITTSISLHSLSNGPHYVEVTGKRDSGLYQDDPLFAEDAVLTRSKTWNVQNDLRITSADIAESEFTLHFPVTAGTTYSVQYRDAFDAGHPWLDLTNIPAQLSSGDYPVTDSPATGQSRFYRIVTPVQ